MPNQRILTAIVSAASSQRESGWFIGGSGGSETAWTSSYCRRTPSERRGLSPPSGRTGGGAKPRRPQAREEGFFRTKDPAIIGQAYSYLFVSTPPARLQTPRFSIRTLR